MGNAVTWSTWLGIVVICLVLAVDSVRGSSRSALLGIFSLGIGLIAGWGFVSAVLKGHPAFFLIVFGSISLLALLGAGRQFSHNDGA